jgi:hypothetical protein
LDTPASRIVAGFASEQMLKIATGTHQDSLLSKAYLQIGIILAWSAISNRH